MQDTYPGRKRSKLQTGIILLGVAYLCFIIGLKMDYLYDITLQLFPLLFSFSLFVLLFYQKHWNIRSLSFLFVIFFSGFFVETLGARTGMIFGEFFYRDALGPKLFGTPILIGVLWLLLVYTTGCLTKEMKIGLLAKCFFSSFLLVLFDIMIEPVAIEYGFWDWRKDYIPLQNYFAWFVISFVMFLYMFNLRGKLRNELAPYLFVMLLLFFLIMNI